MPIRLSPTGVPYFADDSAAPESLPPPPLWRQALLFLLVFAVLQTLWGLSRGSAVERLVIDTLTVRPAAVWITLATPEVPVVASGTRLKAPGGGINILNGCEGIEVLFPLVAAFAVVRLPWRRRLAGLALGSLLVYGLNQVRIVGLFYAYRSDHWWFDALHGVIAPVALVVAVGLFFLAWLARVPRHDAVQAA